jgi:hypothetical protein
MSVPTDQLRLKYSALLAVILFFFFCLTGTILLNPAPVSSAGLSNAVATLSNSRLSFRAGVSASYSAGSNVISVGTSQGINPDYGTSHLFPGDVVCLDDGSNNYRGCHGNHTYTVNRVTNSNTFSLTAPLSGDSAAVDISDLVIASQSGILTVSINEGNTIPANGTITLNIPAVQSGGIPASYDGIPDVGTSNDTNGFDLNGIAASSAVSVSGGTGCTWSPTYTITPGDGSGTLHAIVFTTTTTCQGNITMIIGNTAAAANLLINPAPLLNTRVQGQADVYKLTITIKDNLGNAVDSIDTRISPVEGVLVSATIDKSLSFQVTGLPAGTNACGSSTNVTTTATSVPWGTISAYDTFYNAAQKLTVSTNASNGYAVLVEENDQMGKEGNVCVGSSAGESVNCIQDTTCSASICTESSASDWSTPNNYPGLGFSLQNLSSSSPAVWSYSQAGYQNCGLTPSFCARQFADQEASENKATIMYKAAPSNNDQMVSCFRLTVDAIQPAGYYYNKVKYTATATF